MKPNELFLETGRLILRKFREEDFDDFCAYAMDGTEYTAVENILWK